MIKLLVDEPGSSSTRRVFDEAQSAATTSLATVEVGSALARMRKARRLDAEAHKKILRRLSLQWSKIVTLDVQPVLGPAAELADRYALRGYDAVHLASALAFSHADSTLFACWDRELDDAAVAEGLKTLNRR